VKRLSSSRDFGPAMLIEQSAVVTGVTCTCQSGRSVWSQFSIQFQMRAAPPDVVVIR